MKRRSRSTGRRWGPSSDRKGQESDDTTDSCLFPSAHSLLLEGPCATGRVFLKKKKGKRGRESLEEWHNLRHVGGTGGWNRKPPEETEKKQKSRRKTRAAAAKRREELGDGRLRGGRGGEDGEGPCWWGADWERTSLQQRPKHFETGTPVRLW